jgi:hypothetical protein
MKNLLFTAAMMLVMVTGLALRAAETTLASSGVSVDKEYFTKVGLWHDKNTCFSSNYHVGTFIPAGTKVVVRKINPDKITFDLADGSGTIVLINIPKHSKAKLDEVALRTFSPVSPMTAGGAFSRFTPAEQAGIQKGTIDFGMCKDAVIMAYGYPPASLTPTIAGDTWTYAENRILKMTIEFKDDKVDIIRGKRSNKTDEKTVKEDKKPEKKTDAE